MLSILGKIGFDWQVALANLVNFLIILFILKKFAFNPVKEVIKKRKVIIDKGIEDAKLAETDKVMALELKQKTLMEARIEADKILSKANEEAQKVFNSVKEEANLIKQNIINEGQKTILKEKEEMVSVFKKESARLISSGIEKIIGENMDEKLNEKYVKALK